MSVTYVTPMYFSYFSTTSLRESDWVNTMLSSFSYTFLLYIYIYSLYVQFVREHCLCICCVQCNTILSLLLPLYHFSFLYVFLIYI